MQCGRCMTIPRPSRRSSISRRTILSRSLPRLKMGGGAASCSMRNGACQAGIYSRATLYICFEWPLAPTVLLPLVVELVPMKLVGLPRRIYIWILFFLFSYLSLSSRSILFFFSFFPLAFWCTVRCVAPYGLRAGAGWWELW